MLVLYALCYFVLLLKWLIVINLNCFFGSLFVTMFLGVVFAVRWVSTLLVLVAYVILCLLLLLICFMLHFIFVCWVYGLWEYALCMEVACYWIGGFAFLFGVYVAYLVAVFDLWD